MAVIYYRFRFQKPEHVATIKFDGTGMTVFELKRDIITANSLIHSNDIDLILYLSENIQSTSNWTTKGSHIDTNGDRELDDDNEVIPRSSTVLVRRTMASAKNRGNVRRYITGKPRTVKGNTTTAPTTVNITNSSITTGDNTEDDMIQKMFSAQDEQWSAQQDIMATATRVDTFRANANEAVPDYYICYKCGAKGQHSIKNCPKNNDPNWEGVRIKKTTGIPKSQLKAIQKPNETDADGKTAFMVNEDGNYVVAVADTKAWEKFQNTRKAETLDNEDIDVPDGELKDTESGKLWKNPVRIPCCNKLFSRKFIEDKLIDTDFTCPNCGKENIYLDTLIVDKELQEKVDKYIKDLSTEKKKENPPKRQQLTNAGATPAPMTSIPPMMGMMPQVMPPFMPFMPVMPMNMQQNNSQQNQNQNPNQKR